MSNGRQRAEWASSASICRGRNKARYGSGRMTHANRVVSVTAKTIPRVDDEAAWVVHVGRDVRMCRVVIILHRARNEGALSHAGCSSLWRRTPDGVPQYRTPTSAV